MQDSVSVIIPTFNSTKYIRDTLASAQRAAEGTKTSILLVDDCSNDFSQLEKIAKSVNNCTLIRKAQKGNAAESRNIGFYSTNSEFAFFLDSDDQYHPSHIQSRISQHRATGAAVIFGRFETKYKSKRLLATFKPYSGQDMERYIFVDKGDVRSSTISIWRSAYDGPLFDEQMRKHQDWGFALRSFANGDRIGFDGRSSVTISTSGDHRMSIASNPEASEYFLKTYLVDPDVRLRFLKRCLRNSIEFKDNAAIRRFFLLLKMEHLNSRDQLVINGLQLAVDLRLTPFLTMAGMIKNKFTRHS